MRSTLNAAAIGANAAAVAVIVWAYWMAAMRPEPLTRPLDVFSLVFFCVFIAPFLANAVALASRAIRTNNGIRSLALLANASLLFATLALVSSSIVRRHGLEGARSLVAAVPAALALAAFFTSRTTLGDASRPYARAAVVLVGLIAFVASSG